MINVFCLKLYHKCHVNKMRIEIILIKKSRKYILHPSRIPYKGGRLIYLDIYIYNYENDLCMDFYIYIYI